MKLFNTLAIFLSTFALFGCNPEATSVTENTVNNAPVTEDSINDAPVIEDGHIQIRNAHFDYYSKEALLSKYYVVVSDDEGLDDIVTIEVEPCNGCATIVLKDITSSNSDDHIDLLSEDETYYSENIFYFSELSPSTRPATMKVLVRDSADNVVSKVLKASKPDATEITSSEFFYSESYSGTTDNGVSALPLPVVSSAGLSADYLTVEFNTRSDLVTSVSLYLFDVNEDFIGFANLTAGEFENNASYQKVIDLNATDVYIAATATTADIDHLYLLTHSGHKQTGTFTGFASHDAMGAKTPVN